MRTRASALGVAMVVMVAASALAQTPTPSLDEVARQAEAATATVKKPTKVYTNADLSPAPTPTPTPTPTPAPSPTGFVSKTSNEPVSAEEIIARSNEAVEQDSLEKQSEPRWRKRAEAIRTAMARVEARLVSLKTPNEVRDSNSAAAARHATQVAKFEQGRTALKQDWAKLEEAARVAKVPTAWLDPRPPQ
jgi:hypothetical protein